jgi:hypothetical protein
VEFIVVEIRRELARVQRGERHFLRHHRFRSFPAGPQHALGARRMGRCLTPIVTACAR